MVLGTELVIETSENRHIDRAVCPRKMVGIILHSTLFSNFWKNLKTGNKF
jgi:hypothetical protein